MYAMTEQNLEAYLEQYETSNDMYAYMYVDELMQQPSFNLVCSDFYSIQCSSSVFDSSV